MSLYSRILPDVWRELHIIVATHLPNALLLGGSLRDWDNGRPVKDLDFFFNEDDRKGILDLRTPLGGTHLFNEHMNLGQRETEETGSQHVEIASSLYLPSIEITMPDINLIGVLRSDFTMERQLARFDFGICRIGREITQPVYKTDEYVEDQEAREFVLRDERSDFQRERSRERFERFSQRYHGWKFIDPTLILRELAGVGPEESKAKATDDEDEFPW